MTEDGASLLHSIVFLLGGKMLKMKASREGFDVRLNHRLGKSGQGCSESADAVGEGTAEVRHSVKQDCAGRSNGNF